MQPGPRNGVGPIGAPLPGINRIAVLRGGGLGDLLFTMPAIQSLADAYPGAEITLLGTAGHARLLRDRPGPVARVTVLPMVPGVHEPDSPDALGGPLAGPPADLVVQLHGGGRWSNPFVLGLGARWTIGARTPDAAPLDRWLPYRYYQHEVLRALEVVGLAGTAPTHLEPRIAVTARDREAAAAALAGLPRPYVTVHPGATDPRRRWSAPAFARVAAELTERGHGVVVIGTADEAGVVAEVVRLVGAGPAVRTAAGTLSPSALVGVLAGSALLVGNDSGPRHLAHAVGTPTVAVFWAGNVITAGPFGRAEHRVHVGWATACPVCGANCTDPSGRRCEHEVSFVDDVRVEDVLDDVIDLLERKDQGIVAETRVDDDLWNEFHRVVNMTSRELADWLRTASAEPHGEPLPDQAGTPIGQQVLGILRKRRTDIDDQDVRTMRRVVQRIHAERRADLEPTQGQASWRRRLMSLGHDPLKAS